MCVRVRCRADKRSSAAAHARPTRQCAQGRYEKTNVRNNKTDRVYTVLSTTVIVKLHAVECDDIGAGGASVVVN